MTQPPITFTDGAAYETMMGVWSKIAGEVFLDWLAPPKGLHWVDVGCGNGAFTELLAARCAPAAVEGVDPSAQQIDFARQRKIAVKASFREGGAAPLPFTDASFDAAVMALVIFFVPEPPAGVAEMARVTRPGGLVSAYAWDIMGGGFPWEAFWAEQRGLGLTPRLPPSPEASRIGTMRDLWRGAGLTGVETREITVRRTFADFEDYWTVSQSAPGSAAFIADLSAAEAKTLKERVRALLPADASGAVTVTARANAVKGCRPQ